ncbi:MAG: 2-oxoglutarate dehydrogenase complex dihydrolipoyllysine-residue succinyltransferase [Spirochaetales bacterium]|nr:2-oxoglutarate dehydrogenase complex dihydrolipoyllysine-residue succinyltransferase [Leptospiraceae bacterium]MCP5480678.1 2-oxoglutarate dehydrogenase complex dihydrolipoyllysine-residue succinyltransferase [Spirochaetales bacterium]MCP5484030.1 2-oxoglutarate dehydrogenase complex dihydrolipoyllysine-residue succinyltransferase [Spirochaetales bacterium]
MAQEIKVPQMGESITEATVADWRFQPGERFESGDILVELETDKVTMEVPAPVAGVISEIKRKSGETVAVDDVLATIEEGAAGEKRSSEPSQDQTSDSGKSDSKPAAATNDGGTKNETLPPGARRLAEESGVDTSQISGSGKRGQVTKADVVEHIEGGAKKASSSAAPARAARKAGERETVEPMSRLRQRIAERLVEAQQTAAILTTFNEVDMSAVMELRSRYKDQFKERHGVGLGFMSFFVKASIEALQSIPAINAEIRDKNVVYKNYYDIGVAVGGPRGLVVPIIRDADQLSFAGIEQEILRLASRVKDGSLELSELQGGTFTISNGGIYGSMLSTPILNPPQSGILGMHNIVKRAVVIGDEIKIRPMMYVALSYDHRIVDGKEAVTFLVRLKECIENPERMLLDI